MVLEEYTPDYGVDVFNILSKLIITYAIRLQTIQIPTIH